MQRTTTIKRPSPFCFPSSLRLKPRTLLFVTKLYDEAIGFGSDCSTSRWFPHLSVHDHSRYTHYLICNRSRTTGDTRTTEGIKISLKQHLLVIALCSNHTKLGCML